MEKCCVDKDCNCTTDIETLLSFDNDWNFKRIVESNDLPKMRYLITTLRMKEPRNRIENEILVALENSWYQSHAQGENTSQQEQEMPETILQQAQLIVDGQRRDDYGDMRASFKRIAGMWSSYLGTDVNMFDVAHMMIMLKLSRNHDRYNKDSMVDVCGYAYCADRIHDDELAEKSKFNGEY